MQPDIASAVDLHVCRRAAWLGLGFANPYPNPNPDPNKDARCGATTYCLLLTSALRRATLYAGNVYSAFSFLLRESKLAAGESDRTNPNLSPSSNPNLSQSWP